MKTTRWWYEGKKEKRKKLNKIRRENEEETVICIDIETIVSILCKWWRTENFILFWAENDV